MVRNVLQPSRTTEALCCHGGRDKFLDRQTETDGSDITLVALKLAMSFALFLAKNCTLVSPLLNGAGSHFPLPKALHSSKQSAFFVKFTLFVLPLSNGMTGDRSTETNDQISGCTVLLIEKMNQINTKKTIGIEKKRLCVRLRSEDKHHLRKSADRKAQIRKAFVPLTGLICAHRSANFLRWCLSSKRNLTHNLFFLFPIVFSIDIQ